MKKNRLLDDVQYRDEIYIEDEDANEVLFWSNGWRNDRWGHDNAPDSEYNKMMELHNKYDFTDYDNCPTFWHYVVERDIHGKEVRIDCCGLVEEYFNT